MNPDFIVCPRGHVTRWQPPKMERTPQDPFWLRTVGDCDTGATLDIFYDPSRQGLTFTASLKHPAAPVPFLALQIAPGDLRDLAQFILRRLREEAPRSAAKSRLPSYRHQESDYERT